MAFVTFPEPTELKVPYEQMITDGKPVVVSPWSVENPHPGFGKDPNILNELGHAKFPMWVDSLIEKEANGTPKRIIVNNDVELAQHTEVKQVAPVTPVAPAWPK